MVKLDETGLHAEDCACFRCEIGFRPTPADRWRAREALRLSRLVLDAPPRESAKMKALRRTREQFQRDRDEQRQRERDWQRTHKPVTPEEIKRLREMFPDVHRRRHG